MKRPFAALARTAGVLAACLAGWSAQPALADAGSLRARYADLRTELRTSSFGRALHIDSAQGDNSLQGDVYAVLDHPYAKVVQALREPSQWCDVMLLPFNTKQCRGNGSQGLTVHIGRKYDQPVEEAFRLDFSFRNVSASQDYFESRLNAPSGPFGTRDYRILLEAVPLDSGHTFMHLSYAYAYGSLGMLAIQGYLATAGADKVGFSVVGRDEAGRARYISGVRAAVERNAMRYYLAIDTYLDALDAPRNQQVERRIQSWFSATERYPRQLHEMDRAAYVTMKRQEYGRRGTASPQ